MLLQDKGTHKAYPPQHPKSPKQQPLSLQTKPPSPATSPNPIHTLSQLSSQKIPSQTYPASPQVAFPGPNIFPTLYLWQVLLLQLSSNYCITCPPSTLPLVLISPCNSSYPKVLIQHLLHPAHGRRSLRALALPQQSPLPADPAPVAAFPIVPSPLHCQEYLGQAYKSSIMKQH